jgi:uncharacterized membrane protein
MKQYLDCADSSIEPAQSFSLKRMKMNQAVKTGLIAGIAILLLMFGEVVAPPGTITAICQFGYRIVFIAGVYVAIKRTRDIESPNEFPFKTGLKAGITFGLITSILMSVFMFFQLRNMNIYEFIAELKRNAVTHDLIRQQLSLINNENAMKICAFFATTNIILAFFVSIAVTLLLRKRNVIGAQ